MIGNFHRYLSPLTSFVKSLLQLQQIKRRRKLPNSLVVITTAICVAPVLLNWIGVDFGSPQQMLDLQAAATMTSNELTDTLYRTLAGSFVHTILEWSAFCTALFTALLAIAHFSIKPSDVTTPVQDLRIDKIRRM